MIHSTTILAVRHRDHAVMAAWPQSSWGFRVPESPESEIIKSIFGVLYLAAQKPR